MYYEVLGNNSLCRSRTPEGTASSASKGRSTCRYCSLSLALRERLGAKRVTLFTHGAIPRIGHPEHPTVQILSVEENDCCELHEMSTVQYSADTAHVVSSVSNHEFESDLPCGQSLISLDRDIATSKRSTRHLKIVGAHPQTAYWGCTC